MEEQETYNARTQPSTKKKYYEVVDSDIFLNKKLIPEGTVINTFDASLSNHLRELSEAEIAETQNFYSTVNKPDAVKRGKGRPRKEI
ncbi:MAG: hypothetical protein M0P61_05845 [Ignavibacteriaceae bacterium]|jgi:hypothetical protein|nr:hypothetical protein [Ignavibacteriaceae bacterium]